MGLEMNFLRPKKRASRPGCVESAAAEAGAATDADLETAATTGAVADAGAGTGSTGGVEACASFSVREADESAEPLRRRRLGLGNMAVPMVDLSRSVLLVPVDEEAGGKGDLGFVVLLLESVGKGAACSDAFLAEADRESEGFDADGGSGLARDIDCGRGETEAQVGDGRNNLSYRLREDVVVKEGATSGEETDEDAFVDDWAFKLCVRAGACPMLWSSVEE